MPGDVSKRLGQKSLISAQHLRAATEAHEKKGGDLGRLAVNMGFVDEKRLAAAISETAGLQCVNLAKVTPGRDVLARLPLELATFLCAFPFLLQHDDQGNTLWVAMANPLDESARTAVQRAAGGAVRFMVAGYREIAAAIAKFYEVQASGSIALDAAEEDGEPIKITTLAAQTLFTMGPAGAGAAPAAPQPAAAARPSPQMPGPAAAVTDDRRDLEMLRGVLTGVVNLCLEKGLFTREELAARLKR